LEKAPGDEVVRLCAARIRTEEGQVKESVDTKKPIGIEVEYEILQPGHVFIVYFHVLNQEGIEAFTPFDNDPSWKGQGRSTGRYISTAWIPGRFLAEGMYYIGIGIATLHPTVPRIRVKDAIAFQAIEVIDDDSAIDDYHGKFNGGVVRPFLKWETKFVPQVICWSEG
jgi:lipopolysaccharide transport system ATP-binding protein